MVEHQSPYPAYKPSGVEWLGDVPAHWETLRLKSLACNVSEQTTDHPNGICYIALEHVESWTGRIVNEGAAAGEGQLKRFESGDVLFGKLRPYLAKVVRAKSPGLCVGEFFVLRVRMGISQRFLEYVLRSKAAIDWINSSTFGARMPRTDWAFVGGMRFPLPPLPEQVAIARFLDQANNSIDRYIRAKKRLIALQEEQKRAMVLEAVTGEIDVRSGKPYPAYKHARVEWQQEMPQHWERIRLKALLRSVDRRSVTGDETLLSLRRDHGVVVYAEHFSRPSQSDSLVDYKIVEAGQLVVNRLQANNGLVFCSSLNGLVSPDCSVFERRVPLNMVFLSEALRTSSVRAHFRRHSTGLGTGTSGFLRLYDDKFLNTPVPLPPVAEQDKIVAYIDKVGVSMEAAIRRSRRQIDLLRDYRTRLVADAVTGKVDVREAAAVVPDEGVFAEEKDGLEKRRQPLGENG